jgi:hypothetical protein
MLNGLAGIEDDLGANEAPAEALDHVRKALQICQKEYGRRFAGSLENEPD